MQLITDFICHRFIRSIEKVRSRRQSARIFSGDLARSNAHDSLGVRFYDFYPGCWSLIRSYSFRRYASKAARSSAVTNPRSTIKPFDERMPGKLGGGFSRATDAKKAL